MSNRESGVRHPGDRLRAFTDGVVAIAITLLALPLIEIGSGLDSANMKVLRERLADQAPTFFAFTLSFFVIARLWWAHHALIEGVVTWPGRLVFANTVWLFTIVLVPVVTPFVTEFSPNWLVSLLYVGVMTASSALLSTMAYIVTTDDYPDREAYEAALQRWYGNLVTTTAFTLALVLCMVFPRAYYTPLVVLAFTPIADRYFHRRAHDRAVAGWKA